jgi:hypothetical protein
VMEEDLRKQAHTVISLEVVVVVVVEEEEEAAEQNEQRVDWE